MMEAKHTPGPWWPGHMADGDSPCNCASIVSESYAGSVAVVSIGNGLMIGGGGNDSPPLEEAAANARLIAAAPDLLFALEKILNSGVPIGGHHRALANAAIAKATGA